MKQELDALLKNNTWSVVPLPHGKTAIGCKWLFRTKFKADGIVEMARLVARGFTQQAGIDYLDTFSPVAKLVSVKLMLVVAASKNYSLYHLDNNNAFLYGDLKDDIYMDLPPGYCSNGESVGMTCKLHKSLYGLKHASRQWFLKISSVLIKFGLKKSSADHSYFFKHENGVDLGVIIYVDDIMMASNDHSLVQ